jgi:hypothetical protein
MSMSVCRAISFFQQENAVLERPVLRRAHEELATVPRVHVEHLVAGVGPNYKEME